MRARGLHWQRGFTLLELLIVVAIIVILQTIPSPRNMPALGERVLASRSQSDLREMGLALRTYELANGPLPRQLEPAGFPYALLTTPVAYLRDAPVADPFKVRGVREFPRLFGYPFPLKQVVADHPWMYLLSFASVMTVIVLIECAARRFQGRRPLLPGGWQLLAFAFTAGLLALVVMRLALPADFELFTSEPPEQWRGKYSGYTYFADGSGRTVLQGIGPDLVADLASAEAVFADGATTESIQSALAPFSYDPTNGTVSPGDILRLVW
jgi:prepilin-type N-terminal cleavage/methylation domain-containing protein